ncbi:MULTISPECIES: metal ABC transporter ATP-binding protein [Olsenella]|uniref:metal ABC transporter ATP-binding protein n=1 Tax=Olsenella TaxID=133925 RepID=UPI000780FC7F|nr:MULTISPECIES: metal ABC transporter ATP-binding protein [Olsenella]KXB63760.1 putative manganese transport system ATP-binding protein MntA [Olsenella sp. DNF00959]
MSHTASGDSLRVEGVTLRYSRATHPALEDVSIGLDRGSLCALVGPNGAGKSTLMKVIMGVERPQRGSVSFDGHDSARARRLGLVGYVPQRDVSDEGFPLSVEDVVMLGRYGRIGPLRGPSRADHAAVDEAIERVGLQDLRHRPIASLSGGQTKRMYVARALAQQARFMLMDEPFAGVDKSSEATLASLMRELSGEGITLLVAVHDLHMVAEEFDQVILLRRSVVFQGPAHEALRPEMLARAFSVDDHRARELVA